MKSASHSMTPGEAAKAFYGQDDASFSDVIEKLSATDPRLLKVFNNVRQRYLEQKN